MQFHLLAEIAGYHEATGIAGSADAISDILVFEDRRDFAFAFGQIVELLGDFFFL
jgi:hypothetical protein